MIIKYENVKTTIRANLKEGSGDISIKDYIHKDNMINCRLICEQSIPRGGSIGRHTHFHETEYYIIIKGLGNVVESSGSYQVGPGDLVMTGHREMHSIENCGEDALVMIAIIVMH